jgi:hypothetical protein
MARAPRDPKARLDRPGQRPLLQGHLRPGGKPDPNLAGPTGDGEASEATAAPEPAAARQQAATPEQAATPQPTKRRSAQPAAEGTAGAGDAVRGKATKSPADVATRPHLEGPEEGPK